MILGEESVFFVDNSLRNSGSSLQGNEKTLKYEQIKKIKYYKSHRNFIKIIHFDGSPSNLQEQVIISEDASNLIQSLKCYWQIDNMNRTYTFRELRIDILEQLPEEDEDMHNFQNLTAKSNPARNMPVEDDYMYHVQKNYKFSLKRDFQRDLKKQSKFVDTSSAHTGLQNSTDVQVFAQIPIDYLDKMTDE